LGRKLRVRVLRVQVQLVRVQLVWSYGCARELLRHSQQLLLRLFS
jgi:hypothetical protein